MYKKSPQGWLKHWDFMLIDFICLQVAFMFAYILRNGPANPYQNLLYRKTALSMLICQALVIFFTDAFRGTLKRGMYAEFTAAVKHACLVMLSAVFYLFMTHTIEHYSRMIYIMTAILYAAFSYAVRVIWKNHLFNKLKTKAAKRSMIVITVSDIAEEVLQNVRSGKYQEFAVSGIALLDRDMTGQKIADVPVVGNTETIVDYVCREWVDEVFVRLPDEKPLPEKMLGAFAAMGVTVHLSLARVSQGIGKKQHVERLGNYTVLTTSVNIVAPKQLFYKRVMDIAGGLVGCLATVLIFVVVGPAIYIKSPGPIFFSQTRIGKNGRKFRMYKFRSMYMDAEERKKELMEQNKIKDGFMFKLDYDPRIIGCEKKDRNGNPKGIGNFIRRTSIDEFPQFWNVLKGDMSLVGTRPPTVDEWEKYDLHHRVRMAIKPGITGMWQVSGRSDITDFEEVVKLDTEYIENWTVGLDIKILMKTVLSVVKNEGAV